MATARSSKKHHPLPHDASSLRREAARIPLAEWLVAGLGLLLVAAASALMLREAMSERTAPDLAVAVREISAQGGGHLVRFQASNAGAQTAAEVRIVGVLRGAGGEVERRETTLDYVPGRSSVEGGLFFEADPREGQLVLRAEGYREP